MTCTYTPGVPTHQLIAVAVGLTIGIVFGLRLRRANQRRAGKPLSFDFKAHGGRNFIDQTLLITNPNASDVAPVLAFTALGKDGSAVPGVQVTTAFGSDQGRLVVHSGRGFDVLAFSGPDAALVADVRVTVKKIIAMRTAGPAGYIEAEPLDGNGKQVSRFAPFAAVVLRNPHPVPVSRRIVHLAYDSPKAGASQQVVHRTPIGSLAVVPAGGELVVPVSEQVAAEIRRCSAGRAVSVKTYPSSC